MSPSSRLVAFYFGQNGEVIVDSTLLEIDDGLPNKVIFFAMNSTEKDLYDAAWEWHLKLNVVCPL